MISHSVEGRMSRYRYHTVLRVVGSGALLHNSEVVESGVADMTDSGSKAHLCRVVQHVAESSEREVLKHYR